MSIKKYILDVLKSKEIIDLLPDKKVYFLHAINPNKQLYLEYEIVNEYGEEYSENIEDYTTYIVQIDIFSLGNYSVLEEVVKETMLKNGFDKDMCADLWEEDTKLYHKAMRWSISLKTN